MDRPDALDPLDAVAEGTRDGLDLVKPRLRGWLHLAMTPLVFAAGVVLIALSPTPLARLAACVYAATSLLLFGMSALYHRGRWSARVRAVLRRVDHSNIFLIIAGTYTPFALLVMHGATRVAVLAVVWSGALLGVAFRVCWLSAPRWLYTPLYIALGWVAVFVMPELWGDAPLPTFVLVLVGGLAYTIGAVVYALKRPRLSPRWFGFHEVFHAFTVVGYVTQYVAVSMVTYRIA